MTPDAELAKLLGAVKASGARAIVVGDYLQLDAVGPGGALEALARRHPGRVYALTENVRQRDPAERHALDQLRAGEVPMAVAWYTLQGRVYPAPSRGQAMLDMVRAWAYDVVDGKDALLVAYHRDAVERLNGAARLVWEELGQLSGPRAGGRGREALPGRRPGGHPVTGPGRCLGDLATGGGQLRRSGGRFASSGHARRARSCTWVQAISGRKSSPTPTALPLTGPRAKPWTSPTRWKTAGAENWPTWP